MNWELPNKDEWSLPLFNPGVIVDNSCYMARSDKSGIFRWEIKTNRLKMIHANEKFTTSSYLYGDSVYYGGQIFFIPCVADELLVYKVDDETWEQVPIDTKLCKSRSQASFFGGYVFDNKLWLVPKGSRYIASYDIEKKRFGYTNFFCEKIATLCDKSWPHIIRTETFARSSIWMLLWESNVVIQFDLRIGLTEVYLVGTEGEKFRNIEYDGKYFWLSNQKGELLCWNPGAEAERKYDSFWKDTEIFFKLAGKKIWVFPKYGNEYVAVESVSGKIRRIKVDNTFDSVVQPEYLGGNVLYLMPSKKQRYLRAIGTGDFSVMESTLKLCEKDLQRYQKALLNGLHGRIYEKYIPIQAFIERLQCSVSSPETEQEKVIGTEIYSVCLEKERK